MEFSPKLFFLALLFPLISCDDPIRLDCQKNFTNNEVLKGNIEKVLYELASNTGLKGYEIYQTGNNNNTVYGLSQCRGDIDSKTCSDCALDAAGKLEESCPSTSSSLIWYDICSIRYSNTNFLQQLSINDMAILRSGKTVSNPQSFNTAVDELLVESQKIVFSKRTSFQMMQRTVDDVTIYGLVQCTPDLNGLLCMQCLHKAIKKLEESCPNNAGCAIRSSSCVARYETYNFLLAKDIQVYQEGKDAPSPGPSALTQ